MKVIDRKEPKLWYDGLKIKCVGCGSTFKISSKDNVFKNYRSFFLKLLDILFNISEGIYYYVECPECSGSTTIFSQALFCREALKDPEYNEYRMKGYSSEDLRKDYWDKNWRKGLMNIVAD